MSLRSVSLAVACIVLAGCSDSSRENARTATKVVGVTALGALCSAANDGPVNGGGQCHSPSVNLETGEVKNHE